MGLGRLLTRGGAAVHERSTQYTATDTVTGATQSWLVVDNIAPDWGGSGPYGVGMRIPGAWRAALLISDMLGQVPWHAYRKARGQPEQLLEPTPPLLEQPSPPDVRMTTFSSLGLDLLWHGNAVGLIAARAPGTLWPTAFVPVPANTVGVRRVGRYDDSRLPVGAIEYSVGSIRNLSSQDVIHIKGPCAPGALRGMGVLEQHLETLNLAHDQTRQARSLSTHGVPTGVLKSDNPDLKDEEAAELKAVWMANQASRTIAVLNASTSFTPLSWNPEQLQLVEARKLSLTDHELIFGLPVGWLGGQTSSRVYANIEQDNINLLRFTMGGHFARFEQTLSAAMPRGWVARANLDAFLRPDKLTRYQAHAIGIQAGFLLEDEAREIEHLPPLPEKPPEPDLFGVAQPDASDALGIGAS